MLWELNLNVVALQTVMKHRILCDSTASKKGLQISTDSPECNTAAVKLKAALCEFV